MRSLCNKYIPAGEGEFSLPVGAVGCSACHRPQKVRVDLNHFLDRLRGDPRAGCSSRIHSHYNSVFKPERQGGGAVSKFYLHAIFSGRELPQKFYRLQKKESVVSEECSNYRALTSIPGGTAKLRGPPTIRG